MWAPDSCPNLRKVRRDWVIKRQAVTTDKDSGIINNANLWATMKIVNNLPKREIP